MKYKEFNPGDEATIMLYPTPLIPALRIFTATVESVEDGIVCFDDPRIPFETFYYNEDRQKWQTVLVDSMLGPLGTLVESIDEPVNMMHQRLTLYSDSISKEDYKEASWILDNLDTIPLPILRWASNQLTYLGVVANLSKKAWVAETSHPDAIGISIDDTYYSPYDYRIEED